MRLSHTDLSSQFVENTVYQACDLCTFIYASNGIMILLLHDIYIYVLHIYMTTEVIHVMVILAIVTSCNDSMS